MIKTESTRVDLKVDEAHIVVHLRPEPGKPAPQPMVVKANFQTNPRKVEIGQAGELKVTERRFMAIGRSGYDYDQVVMVFAPHAWLYYEYVVKELP